MTPNDFNETLFESVGGENAELLKVFRPSTFDLEEMKREGKVLVLI